MLLPCHFALAQHISNDELVDTFVKRIPKPFQNLTVNAGAVAIGDVNQDGWDDLVILERSGSPRIYFFRPDSGDFFRLPNANITITSNQYSVVNLIDTNGDGNKELFIHYNQFEATSRMYGFNSVDSSFTSLPLTGAIAANSFRSGMHYNFADFNKDGRLDALQSVQTGRTPRNYVLMNVFSQGGTNFTNNVNSPAVLPIQRTNSTYLYDFNNDGFVDIWEVAALLPAITTDQDNFFSGSINGFTQVFITPIANFTTSVGAAVGDYNNDGLMDIYQVMGGTSRANVLFRNEGNFNFSTPTNFTTLDVLDSRNAHWGDFDNDGDLDLVVAEYRSSTSADAFLTLYENIGPDNNGAYQFTKRVQAGFSELNARGNWTHAFFWDYTKNGQLDIFAFGDHTTEPVVVFDNVGNENAWLGFTLQLTNAFYKMPYGTKLRLTATINGRSVTQFREHSPFSGFRMQHSDHIHFGLGNATSAQLQITWPNGQITNHSFNQASLKQYHHIIEPPAGVLQSVNSLPVNITRNISIEQLDTVRFTNTGQGTVTVNGVQINRPYFQVVDYSRTLASGATGFVAYKFFTENTLYLGLNQDTIKVLSSAVNNSFSFPLRTTILTRPALFSQIEATPNIQFVDRRNTLGVGGIADFFKQGYFDAVFTRLDSVPQFFRSTSEQHLVLQTGSAFSQASRFSQGVSIADIDLDGYLDVILANTSGVNSIFKNDGNSLVSSPISGTNQSKNSTKVSVYDLDKNGFPDLIISNTSGARNDILFQQVDNTFLPLENLQNDFISTNNYASSHILVDLDEDGKIDIITVSDNNPNGDFVRYFRQINPQTFKLTTVQGLTTSAISARGILAFDHNNNGRLDLLVLSARQGTASRFYQNNGNLSFEQRYATLLDQVKGQHTEALILDFNMDGFLDLFLADNRFDSQNVLLQSTGGNGFLNITTGSLVNQTNVSALGSLLMDYNRDGRPDILVFNFDDKPALFQNTDTENNWLGIRPLRLLENGRSVPVPFTKVQVTATIAGGTVTQTRILGQTAVRSQNLSELMFGLGSATSASVRIQFPDADPLDYPVSEINRYYTFEALSVGTEPIQGDIPQRVQLHQNYPNPFNPSTVIRFNLPESAEVSLTIYNILGQRVATLVQQKLSAGIHERTFEAGNLSSGIYLGVLQVSGQTKTIKLTLLK